MSVDDIVKLLDAITKLLNVLIWPAVLLFILIRFSRDLREFFSSLGELSLKGAGFEASLKRKQAEVAAALAAAAASRSDGDTTRESAAKEAKIAADVVAEVVTPRAIRRASRSTVLWVDDRPNNNIYERQALEALGVNFVLATSTDEALKKIVRQRFDAIISDMGRPPDPVQVIHFSINYGLVVIELRLSFMPIQEIQNTLQNHAVMVPSDVRIMQMSCLKWYCLH